MLYYFVERLQDSKKSNNIIAGGPKILKKSATDGIPSVADFPHYRYLFFSVKVLQFVSPVSPACLPPPSTLTSMALALQRSPCE
jgi:hypothetical protein